MKNNKIIYSILLPAYEEAENLKLILPKISKFINRDHFEVIVIDKMISTDLSPEIVKKNSFKYINREINDNYGDAVRSGIKVAKGDYLIFMDCDGSHNPSFIKQMLKYHKSHDLVTASRYIKNGKTENPFILNIMSRFLNFTYNFFLRIPILDISNSFKMYKREDIIHLNLVSKNFDIIQEIVMKIFINNPKTKVKELPFNFMKRKYGVTKRNLFLFVISYLFTIIKLLLIKYKIHR